MGVDVAKYIQILSHPRVLNQFSWSEFVARYAPNLGQNSIKSYLLLAATINRLCLLKMLYGILLRIYGPHFHNSWSVQLILTNMDAGTQKVANYARKLQFVTSLFL